MKLTQNLKSYNKYDIFNMFLDFLSGGLDFKESSLEAKVTNLFFEENGNLLIMVFIFFYKYRPATGARPHCFGTHEITFFYNIT